MYMYMHMGMGSDQLWGGDQLGGRAGRASKWW